MTLGDLPLYNPDRLSDEQFVDVFVARGETVEAILNDLRAQAERGETAHALIVGARGMGKTSLLRRIAIGVTTDDRLSKRLLPLRFREEQYNIVGLDAFWRNCGESLAEWCEQQGRDDEAAELDATVASSVWRDAEKARDAFFAACAKIGRRPVLFVDNLDIVVDTLKVQDAWLLRAALQKQGGPIVIGAATRLLAQGGDREAPFYEFFFPHVLEPLDEAELMRCMRALADKRGDKGDPVRKILSGQPARLKALFALTGGNPRVLALIYQLMERADGEEVFSDLERLLDLVTPYYKARVEEYAATHQRAIVDAIALNWDPMTSNAIAEVTGIEQTTLSAPLARLRKDGFVEEVATSGTRAGYQISERFLNIWYLMRHGTRRTRQRLRWLTLFLARLFSAEELGRMASEALGDGRPGRWRADWLEAVQEVYTMACGGPSLALPDGATDSELQTSLAEKDTLSGNSQLLREYSVSLNDCLALIKDERWEEVLKVIDAMVERLSQADEALPGELALCLFAKGQALKELGRMEEAQAADNAGIGRIDRSDEPMLLRGLVAMVLVNRGAALGKIGRFDEAIVEFDAAIERSHQSEEPELREQVAKALINKGIALQNLGRMDEALAAYDALIERFGQSEEAELRELLAQALVNKSVTLRNLGHTDEALTTYDAVIGRFGQSAEPALCERVAKAFVNKALLLFELGRLDEALAASNAPIERFARMQEPTLREQVAKAFLTKGVSLFNLGRADEAITNYDTAIERSGRPEKRAARMLVAGSLLGKGEALENLGRADDALAAYKLVVEQFADNEDPGIRSGVGLALNPQGRIFLDWRGDASGAEYAFRRAVAYENVSLMARANLAWVLLLVSRGDEAERLRAELVELDPSGLLLLDSGREFARDNFGLASKHLKRALDLGLEEGKSPFFEDLLRLLRLAEARGYGERLVGWFEETGYADRYAPVHAALVAYVRGERFLLDVNPEVRAPAQKLLTKLNAPRSHLAAQAPQPAARRRGRPRKPR